MRTFKHNAMDFPVRFDYESNCRPEEKRATEETTVPTYYGDTTGTLSGSQSGGAQILRGGLEPIDPYTGRYNDQLYGDAQALAGHARGGNDIIYGVSASYSTELIAGDAATMDGSSRGGNDTIFGGFGSHLSITIVGDALELHGASRGGNDLIYPGSNGASGGGFVAGDARTMDGTTRGGDDTIIGGGIGMALYGDASILSGHARGGNDHFRLSDGAQSLYAYGDGRLTEHARGGNDVIVGGSNAPYVMMYGDGALSDQARGGNDILIAGSNSFEIMWGDGPKTGTARGGSDTFVFATGSGRDQIMDFEQGKDHIDLTGYASQGIHGFADLTLVAGAVIGDSDPNATSIQFSTSSVVVVHGVPHLTATDFLFA